MDSQVEISRVVRWAIDNWSSHWLSVPFKLGNWNWFLSLENSGDYLSIRLSTEPSHQPPPLPCCVLRIFDSTGRPYSFPVREELLRTSDGLLWHVGYNFHGRLIIEVEFLDLKTYPNNCGNPISIWSCDDVMQTVSSQSTLRCLSRILDESIHADVTINLSDGTLRAHKAVLSACSPVFQAMFHHNLRENEISVINIEDMSLELCPTLLSYLYGTIKQEDLRKHRIALAVAADKYDIRDLKDACEESLLEDINSENVLDRVQLAWLYQLDKLKKGCFRYLFHFGNFYDVRDEMTKLFKQADRELMLEIFQDTLAALGPA